MGGSRTRRSPATTTRRRKIVRAGRGKRALALEDAPLRVAQASDPSRLWVVRPYEIDVVLAAERTVERTIPVASARPWVCETDGGGLWVGGRHLHHGSLFSTELHKVGAGLRGLVDVIALARPSLLVGAGALGDAMVDTEDAEVTFRRKEVRPGGVLGIAAGADGRAVLVTGEPHAWIFDPDHPHGHTRLPPIPGRAAGDVSDPVVAVAPGPGGFVALATRGGTVAWTQRTLRVAGHATPARAPDDPGVLSLFADATHVYALRPGGRLERFRHAPIPEEDDAPTPPRAEHAAVGEDACTICRLVDGTFVVGRREAGGFLGSLAWIAPSALAFEPLPLADGPRSFAPLRAHEPPPPPRVEGPGLGELSPDTVLKGPARAWRTTPRGDAPATWPHAPADDPNDPAPWLVAAMVRPPSGPARPALVLAPREHETADVPRILVWGDAPREWIELSTPAIRAQGWRRREIFPLEVALAVPPEHLDARDAALDRRWANPERFEALAAACRRELAVVW